MYGASTLTAKPGLHLNLPFAITDTRIVDYSIKAAELVHLVGNCFCPSDGREVSGDNSSGAGCCRERIATSTLVLSMQYGLALSTGVGYGSQRGRFAYRARAALQG
jgi:hypothetical protein